MRSRLAGAGGCRFDGLSELRHDRNVTVLNSHRLAYSLDQAASPGAVLAPDTPSGLNADRISALGLASASSALARISGYHYGHGATRLILVYRLLLYRKTGQSVIAQAQKSFLILSLFSYDYMI